MQDPKKGEKELIEQAIETTKHDSVKDGHVEGTDEIVGEEAIAKEE